MDCRSAHFYLRLRRHTRDELGPEPSAALDAHLAACPECAAAARSLAADDAAMARAMADVPVPAGLRQRLTARLTATRQRAAYRRRTLRLVGAAAVLVAFGIGSGLSYWFRPTLSLDAVVNAADLDAVNPYDTTRDWLAAQRLPEQLPEPFDLGLLVARGTGRIQGQDVPVLVFRPRHGPGFARVYFVRDWQFNTSGLPYGADSSNARVQVRRAGGGLVYLIVHTGPDLAPFLRAGGPDQRV
jgi:anti-sigma factor RsiW